MPLASYGIFSLAVPAKHPSPYWSWNNLSKSESQPRPFSASLSLKLPMVHRCKCMLSGAPWAGGHFPYPLPPTLLPLGPRPIADAVLQVIADPASRFSCPCLFPFPGMPFLIFPYICPYLTKLYETFILNLGFSYFRKASHTVMASVSVGSVCSFVSIYWVPTVCTVLEAEQRQRLSLRPWGAHSLDIQVSWSLPKDFK